MQEVRYLGHIVSRIKTKRTILLHPQKVILGQSIDVHLVRCVLFIPSVSLGPGWESHENLVFVLREKKNPALCQLRAKTDEVMGISPLPALFMRVVRLYSVLRKPSGHLCALLHADRHRAFLPLARLHLYQTVGMASSVT